MGHLADLFDRTGQSPWLDNLRRSYLRSGELARFVERGVRGVTSNPSIFQKAIADSTDYDEQFDRLLSAGVAVEDAYWTMVVDDITDALDVLAPVHADSGGLDGFVSVEVDPALAHDTEATIAAARALHERIDRPNLMVKIPATEAGLPAIRQMIAEGRSTNVTLIFSLERYQGVMEAYLAGLEERVAAGLPVDTIRSVASFFVSRVDSDVDARLDAAGTDQATALKGRAALAQARVAYDRFRSTFAGPRWDALVAAGAHVQRPLWASTSTKNAAYPDTIYVDGLIGPDTVNTLPEPTLEAFDDHGTVARTVDAAIPDAEATLGELDAVGIDLAEVAETLERDGVAAFQTAFEDLLDTLRAKAAGRAA